MKPKAKRNTSGTGFSPSTPPDLAAALRMAALATRVWSGIGTEVSLFLCNRLQRNVAAQRQILASADPQEWRRIQLAFLKEAQHQYVAETGRILSLMGATTALSWPVDATSRRYDDVPL